MRLWTIVTACATACALWATPVSASAPLKPGQLGSSEAALGWLSKYRRQRVPEQVPEATKALSALGAFKDPDNAGVYVGFLAGVIGTNARPDELVAKLAKALPPEDQWALVRAIAYSSRPDWKPLLSRVADRMPTRRRMIEDMLAGKLPILSEISFAEPPGTMDRMKDYFRVDKYFSDPPPKKSELVPSPAVLDTLWGYYFATGAWGPIARIVLMLPLSKDKENVERLTVGSMAKFTLATNATRDAALLAMLQQTRSSQPKTVGPILGEVIDAAETVETGKIRQEALAALEDLKAKGPMSRRNVAWWGQMGEGAIAVGCIAAAAVGTVALGVPCVVGGAVTSAGLRYLGSP